MIPVILEASSDRRIKGQIIFEGRIFADAQIIRVKNIEA